MLITASTEAGRNAIKHFFLIFLGCVQQSLVFLAIFLRRAVHVPAKDTVEIADITVAAIDGDGADAGIALPQQIAGDADAVVIQIFHGGHIDLSTEKTAELPFAHMKAACQFRYGRITAVIGPEILENLLGQGTFFIGSPLVGGRGGGRRLTEEMPDPQQIRFDQQLTAGYIPGAQRADLT